MLKDVRLSFRSARDRLKKIEGGCLVINSVKPPMITI